MSKSVFSALLVSFLAAFLTASALGREGEGGALPLALPHYEFQLGPAETALFHELLQTAARDLGAETEFEQKIQKGKDGVASVFTIRNPAVFESCHYWAVERAAQRLAATDLQRLGEENRRSLQTAGSLYASLAAARRNPLYDTQVLSGKIELQGELVWLQGPQGRFALAWKKAQALRPYVGAAVRVYGVQKEQGRFDLERIVERKENTLEVFVMSHCPMGRQALGRLIRHIRNAPPSSAPPRLEVRYLFYLARDAAGQRFTSLHGEAEIEENLVQIVLRQDFPQSFLDYLLLRESSDRPWQELAQKLGLRQEEIKRIETRTIAEREALIEAEYSYAAASHGIFDGSPTYLWEGGAVADLRGIEAFHQMEPLSASCSTPK